MRNNTQLYSIYKDDECLLTNATAKQCCEFLGLAINNFYQYPDRKLYNYVYKITRDPKYTVKLYRLTSSTEVLVMSLDEITSKLFCSKGAVYNAIHRNNRLLGEYQVEKFN